MVTAQAPNAGMRSMNYTLYNRPGSGGFVVEAALALADAPFEPIESAVGRERHPESIGRWRDSQPGPFG